MNHRAAGEIKHAQHANPAADRPDPMCDRDIDQQRPQ
jgi:hypothetical protein